jgi:hypothetical protein
MFSAWKRKVSVSFRTSTWMVVEREVRGSRISERHGLGDGNNVVTRRRSSARAGTAEEAWSRPRARIPRGGRADSKTSESSGTCEESNGSPGVRSEVPESVGGLDQGRGVAGLAAAWPASSHMEIGLGQRRWSSRRRSWDRPRHIDPARSPRMRRIAPLLRSCSVLEEPRSRSNGTRCGRRPRRSRPRRIHSGARDREGACSWSPPQAQAFAASVSPWDPHDEAAIVGMTRSPRSAGGMGER